MTASKKPDLPVHYDNFPTQREQSPREEQDTSPQQIRTHGDNKSEPTETTNPSPQDNTNPSLVENPKCVKSRESHVGQGGDWERTGAFWSILTDA